MAIRFDFCEMFFFLLSVALVSVGVLTNAKNWIAKQLLWEKSRFSFDYEYIHQNGMVTFKIIVACQFWMIQKENPLNDFFLGFSMQSNWKFFYAFQFNAGHYFAYLIKIRFFSRLLTTPHEALNRKRWAEVRITFHCIHDSN